MFSLQVAQCSNPRWSQIMWIILLYSQWSLQRCRVESTTANIYFLHQEFAHGGALRSVSHEKTLCLLMWKSANTAHVNPSMGIDMQFIDLFHLTHTHYNLTKTLSDLTLIHSTRSTLLIRAPNRGCWFSPVSIEVSGFVEGVMFIDCGAGLGLRVRSIFSMTSEDFFQSCGRALLNQ